MNGENYVSWCRQLKLVLEINDCPIDELLDETGNSAAFKKKSLKALGVILTYMSQDVIDEVIDTDEMSFTQVWKKLESEFGPSNPFVKEKHREKIMSIKLTNEKDLTKHIQVMQDMFKISANFGLFESESEKIELYLKSISSVSSLSDVYKYVGMLKTFEEVITATIGYIKYKEMFGFKYNNNNNHSNYAVSMRKNDKKCFTCGKVGHIQKFCRKNNATTNQNSSETLRSKTNFAKENNEVRLKQKPIPTNFSRRLKKKVNKINSVDNNNSNKILTLNSDVLSRKLVNGIWYFDSGAACSVTWDKSMFTKYYPVDKDKKRFIQTANGENVEVKGTGNVVLNVNIDKKTSNLELKDVLHVPEVNFQLISLSNLVCSGYTVDLNNTHGIVTTSSGKVVLQADLDKKEKLWKLSTDFIENTSNILVVSKNRKTIVSKTLNQWHVCLGHRNHEDILKMYKNNEVEGMKITDFSWNGCNACNMSKGGKTPISKISELRLTTPGFLVGDLMDFGVRCYGNFKYVSSFIDVKTRYCSVKLLKSKAATGILEHLKEFVEFISTQTKNKYPVTTLLTDNGTEYVNDLIKTYLLKNGIVHKTSSPYTPQQNGIAERKNRYLSECTRACMIQYNLDDYFWGEILLSVNHVQNRLTHRKTEISPFEALFGRKATVNYFKSLGQRVYVLKSDLSGKKTKARFDEAILLGYDENSPQFKVWNVATDKLQLSRNVKFTENETLNEEIDSVEIEQIPETLLIKRHDEDNPTLSQILRSPDVQEWKFSMQKEYDNLVNNNVIELVPFENQRCLNVIPIFKIKRDEIGNLKSRKTRFVVQGFRQKEGIDYHDTYAPVSNYSSLLILLSIVVSKKLLCHQVDFDAAFLNATLKEHIYVKSIPGIEQTPNFVFKLKKTLYGLKQAPHEWWQLLKTKLIQLGWKQCITDECFFFRDLKIGQREYLLVYVDDLVIASPFIENINQIKTELAETFSMKDLGELKQILGMRVTRNIETNSIMLDQLVLIEKYAKDFLSSYPNIPIRIPSLLPPTSSNVAKLSKLEYASRIGALSYIVRRTRPDLAAVCGILARRQSCFTDIDCEHLNRVFLYLYLTKDKALTFLPSTNLSIETYVDADWAGNVDDRRSVSGSIVYVGKSPVLWGSKRQEAVATSTMESEYYALSESMKDTLMIKHLLEELLIKTENSALQVPIVFCDNQAAIATSLSNGPKRKIRHVEIKYHFFKHHLDEKNVKLVFIPTAKNKADGLTKILGTNKVGQAMVHLGLSKLQ